MKGIKNDTIIKGGKPYGIEVTGYYDNDNKLIDIRVKKRIDPVKYKAHHGVELDPPKNITEQIMDLFNFDQKYTSKANKRLQHFLDPNSDPNKYKQETKYIVVNDEDDIKKIQINNDLIKKTAILAQTLKKFSLPLAPKAATKIQSVFRKRAITKKTPGGKRQKQNGGTIDYDNVKTTLLNDYNNEDKKIAEQIMNTESFKTLVKQSIPGLNSNTNTNSPQQPVNNLDTIINAIARIEASIQALTIKFDTKNSPIGQTPPQKPYDDFVNKAINVIKSI